MKNIWLWDIYKMNFYMFFNLALQEFWGRHYCQRMCLLF